jgi:DNA recombination protein RmuC
MSITALSVLELIGIAAVLILLILLMRRSGRTSVVPPELMPGLEGIDVLRRSQDQIERSVREEFSRGRQEMSGLGQSLRSEVVTGLSTLGESIGQKVENLARSNDQRLELVRSSMEQRLSSFSAESSQRLDRMSQLAAETTKKFQGEVTTQLADYRAVLERAIDATHNLQREHVQAIATTFQAFQSGIDERQVNLQATLRDNAKQHRDETGLALKHFGETMVKTLGEITQLQKAELIDLRSTVDLRLTTIQIENEKKLEQMRQTVDEKLQGTLEARLGESFKQVSDRLEQVYKGLGEMQSLAAGVGDLKRVLSNVKTRGTWGEVQLGALLEQILAPDQYSRNVATTGTGERVEFAIRLPGREGSDTPVWFPIDAKFPIEDYQRLMDASERGDTEAIDRSTRQLEGTVRACAKNISEKYISPPATTDFGILFLPTEGLYAEVMRRPGLAESIQREHRVALTGPSTLAALLNSFQMGFRTLAIQKRSSAVWETLGIVKTEFGKYADVLSKVKKKLNEAQNTIDRAETRTRVIQRSLRDVESLSTATVFVDDIEEETTPAQELLPTG